MASAEELGGEAAAMLGTQTERNETLRRLVAEVGATAVMAFGYPSDPEVAAIRLGMEEARRRDQELALIAA